MSSKTADEQWVENFISRHPALRSRISNRKAAESIWHDVEVLAPDRAERLEKLIVRKTLIELITAVQTDDKRTIRRILRGGPRETGLKLLDAIKKKIAEKEGRKEGGR